MVLKQDDGRKVYLNLMKKLKKEVGDRQVPSLQHIRQLLPMTRSVTEIIAVEPIGSLTDSKGNKISFDSIDKKHGFQVRIPSICHEIFFSCRFIYRLLTNKE